MHYYHDVLCTPSVMVCQVATKLYGLANHEAQAPIILWITAPIIFKKIPNRMVHIIYVLSSLELGEPDIDFFVFAPFS
jgi:hypothetical protein